MPHVPGEQIALAYSGLWLTHAAGLTALVWVLKRTTYGRRWGDPVEVGLWQFSMKHLLMAMTTFAVLVFVLRSSEMIRDVWLWVAIVIVNNTGVALACVLVQSSSLACRATRGRNGGHRGAIRVAAVRHTSLARRHRREFNSCTAAVFVARCGRDSAARGPSSAAERGRLSQ